MSTYATRKHTFAELISSGTLLVSDGYRAKNEELGGNGLIFLRAGNVTDSRIDITGTERFRAELESRVRGKVSEPGDVIVTTKGNSTGRVSYVTPDLPPFVYSPHLSFWRSLKPDELVPGFLRAWSRGPEFQRQLQAFAHGTDMAPYLSLIDQKRVCITLPPPPVQRDIAHILGTLDDKIELNRRMNQTLEEIARAIFSSWLADNSLPRAKIADLISRRILEIGDGYRAKNTELGKSGLPFIRAGNLNEGFDTTNADVLSPESVEKAGSKVSRVGDVAFTSKGTIGRFARVTEYTERFVYSPQVCYWRSIDPTMLHPIMLYCWMQSADLRAQLLAVAGQTDMAPYVSLQDQRKMSMPIFPTSQHEVVRRIEPLLARQSLGVQETKTLAALRDTLLPKLISGELRIPDAEQLLAAVL